MFVHNWQVFTKLGLHLWLTVISWAKLKHIHLAKLGQRCQ